MGYDDVMLRNAYVTLGGGLLAAAVAGLVAACGSVADTSGFGANPAGDAGSAEDGSVADGSSTNDAGLISDAASTDSGLGGEDGGTANPDTGVPGGDSSAPQTGALFVHASPDLPDVRLCWYVGDADAGSYTFSNTDAPLPSGAPAPASNYPALPVGGAVALAEASTLLGGNLHIRAIPAALLSAIETKSGPPKSCGHWLNPGANNLPVGFPLYDLSAQSGVVVLGATNVIALAGCAPGDSALAAASAAQILARCGPGYTLAGGNLRLDVKPLHEVAASPLGQIPVQAAQLSPALAQLAGDAGVIVSFGPQGAGATVATLPTENALDPQAAKYLDTGTDASAYGTLGFGVDIAGQDGGAGHLWMSLEQALELQDPTMNPAVYYANQTTFVVAVIGDPAAPHAFGAPTGYDGTGLHVLVLPLP